MQDNGFLLKNIGMQLQTISMQIKNMGIQISNFNQNFGMQMQNIGIQITNMANQIFNIGMQFSNENQIPMNFGMPKFNDANEMKNWNMMNDIGMGNFPINENINDFNINDKDKYNDSNNEEKIYICFKHNTGKTTTVVISPEKTVKELLDLYRIKLGENIDFLKNNWFLFNGCTININEERTIKDYGIPYASLITVAKKANIIT